MPKFCYFSFQFPTNWEVPCLFTACPVLPGRTALHETVANWDRFAVLLLSKDWATTSTFFGWYSASQLLAPRQCQLHSPISCLYQALLLMAIHVPCKYTATPGTQKYFISFRGLDSRNLSVKGQFLQTEAVLSEPQFKNCLIIFKKSLK